MERREDTRGLMERYRTLLAAGETLSLPVQGSSMAPFLVHRRDAVWLSAPKDPLRVGEVALYQRRDGSYLLHRICRVEGDRFTMVGDAHTVTEPGVSREQIFAVVTGVRRKGKELRPGSLWWEFFARVWVRVIPLRPAILRLYGALSKCFGRSA